MRRAVPTRQDWEHSIAPVKGLRYSITLRTLRDMPGSNEFKW